MNNTFFSARRALSNIIRSCIEFNYDNTHIGYSKYCKYETELDIIISETLDNIISDYYKFSEFNDTIKFGNKEKNLARKLNIYLKMTLNNKNSELIKYYKEELTIDNFVKRFSHLIKEFENFLHS